MQHLPRSRRTFWAIVAAGFAVVVVAFLIIVWTQRRQIASDYIQRTLERRGVQATYRVAQIGLGAQRIENVVIGDPQRSDLIAKWVEIKLSWGLAGPRVGHVTARGVRLNGRIVNGKVRFGEVDKLLPKPSTKAFILPDLGVDIADTIVTLDTKVGQLGIAVAGAGNLADGFKGEIVTRPATLTLGSCLVDHATIDASIAIRNRRPAITGPVRAAQLRCDGHALNLLGPALRLNANFSEAFDIWQGDATLLVERAGLGSNEASRVAGRISFTGNRALTRGVMDIGAGYLKAGHYASPQAHLQGSYALAFDSSAFSMRGDVLAQNIAAGRSAVQPLTKALSSIGATPAGPLGQKLGIAIGRAAKGFDARASLRLVNVPGSGSVRIERLLIASTSGAQLTFGDGEGAGLYWGLYRPRGHMRIDGNFSLSGGGFPVIHATFRQPRGDAQMQGQATIAPFTAGNARLVLAPIHFRPGNEGMTEVVTAMQLSGPIGNGYVRNLSLPVTGSFGGKGFVFGEHCIVLDAEAWQVASLSFGRTRLPICPTGRALLWRDGKGRLRGSADLRKLALLGRLGKAPIALTSERVQFDFAEPGFASSALKVRLGAQGSQHQLDIDRLNGRFNAHGLAGAFAGARGRLASVPLLLSDGRGEWRIKTGALSLDGSIAIADAMDPPRFYPLVSNDVHLSLADNKIKVTGWLSDPQTGTRITQAAIEHDLDTASGRALLDVPGLTFDPQGYQPEELTRLTTGVVALVDGTIKGKGQIHWNEQGVTSTGSFSTKNMNLAAAFGTVEGLSTTINFTDLLGRVSVPGQLATVKRIRTGIDVFDGMVRYQTLPDAKVRVESGYWPFAGGELTLEETLLDFGQAVPKSFTFHINGLDAATFIQQMEFANIAATGTFDGAIPMVFDLQGGRIVGGHLQARPGGGTLSYIGVVSGETLGAYGTMAFDALKSLRYDKLAINLDGSLQGEFVAGIQLDGIARNTKKPRGITGYVLGQIAKLGFEFNIVMRGPFRALIGTARSFEDPSLLIQAALPKEFQDQPTEIIHKREDKEKAGQDPSGTAIIQHKESEGMQ